MHFQFRAPLLVILVLLAFAGTNRAAVVFKPGEKAKYVAPGEEEMSGNAFELFHIAQEGEKRGNLGRAIKAYRALVRRHPKDALAPGSAFRCAELLEQTGSYLEAASAYRHVVEKYPTDIHFEQAIEGQFRIGELYLHGKKTKFLGISLANAWDRAVEIFAAVIRTAPYGKYTARAQFDIGLAREKQGVNDAALAAYQAVIDKFPNDPVAANAQYQIGYLWFSASKQGTKDLAATERAKTAFQDFLFRYPSSEKAAQARSNLQVLSKKETSSSFNIAKFYDKQKNYRAAAVYYNEVIRQQPGSSESEKAKKRIDQLRAKFGEAALQPASVAKQTDDKKKTAGTKPAPGPPGTSATSSGSAGPLPPQETDASLPPPASLMPDTTTAPAPSATPEASAAPEASGSPDATASTAP